IDSYDFGSVSTGGSSGFQITVLNHTGKFLPPASGLQKGAQWDNTYTLQSTDGSTLNITDDVQEHFTVAGTESVTVGGKTFDTVRIDITSNSTITGGTGAGGSFSSTSSYWVAQGVGPVQWQTTFNGDTSMAALTSYSVP